MLLIVGYYQYNCLTTSFFFYTFDHEQASEETLDDLPVKFTQVS